MDEEFKRESIRLAKEAKQNGKSIASVARNLGIKGNTLYTWISKSVEETNGTIVTDSEIRALKKKLRNTEEERDILKKAVAIFSKLPR